MDSLQFRQLVNSFKRLPAETEWVEFKVNNAEPSDIGEYISALSNSAALLRQPMGFMAWGIEDVTHEPVGTSFKPKTAKTKNQDLENWLSNNIHPRVDFRFHEGSSDGKPIVHFGNSCGTAHTG